MPLDREIAVFRALLPSLLADHEGKWAVVSDDELSTADTYEAALKLGYERYGPVSFLVKQILAVEPVLHFTSGLADDRLARVEVRQALQPFVDFLAWMDAAREIGEVEFTDESCVTSLHLGGGSAYLWVHQFRRLTEVWRKYLPGPGVAVDPMPPDDRLARVEQAVRDYHAALDREGVGRIVYHACVAVGEIERAMGMPWVPGEETGRLKATTTGEPG